MARPAALEGLPLLEDLGDVKGKRVLVRTDFNVPLKQGPNGPEVADDFRIRSALPTLRWLTERGAIVVCASHLGRPDGVPDPQYSMAPVAAHLSSLLPGVEVLENLRFSKGETSNDPAFVADLIEGFDAYVNDAFGVSHRSHASVVGPPSVLPSAAGRLVEREVETLGGLLGKPSRPFVAIVGGAKVADKLGVLQALAKVADSIIVGGGMAFTFLAAQERSIGGSLFDPTRVNDCLALLDGDAAIVLPSDIVALSPGASFGPGEIGGEVATFEGDLPDGWVGLDVGPASSARFSEVIKTAGTVLWNGPMGAFEDDRFAAGTSAVGHAVADCAGESVIGGGDSCRAIEEMGLSESVSFMSTGGGASLEFIEFGDLPALVALRHAVNAPRSQ
jgi:phosphoglycerate kinase